MAPQRWMSAAQQRDLTMDIRKLRAAWHLNEVTRFHMVTTKSPQDVAQHSFRVAFLAKHIAENAVDHGAIGINPDHAFYLGACHDMDEMTTGDIPSHVKIALRNVGIEVAALAERDGFENTPSTYKWIIKAADLIESIYWCEVNVDQADIRASSVQSYIIHAFDDFMVKLPSICAEGPIAFNAVSQARDDVYHITHSWCQNYDLKWPVL